MSSREPRPRSLRFALLRLVLGALAPLMAVSALSLWLLWEAQRREEVSTLQQQAGTLAQAVEQLLRSDLAILETLAVLPEIEGPDLTEFHTLATAAIAPHPHTWIVLIDLSGRQTVHTRVAPGAPLADLRHLLEAREEVEWRGRRLPTYDARVLEPGLTGRPVVSDLFYGPVLQVPVLSAGVPVIRDGRPISSLHIGLTPDALTSLLVATVQGGDTLAAIIDRNGRVVARSTHADRFVGMAAAPPFDQPAAGPSASVGEARSLDGVSVVYASRLLDLCDWTVIVAVSRREHLAPVVRTLVPWLVATLAVVGAAVHQVLRLWDRLARPLTGLAAAADQPGQLDVVAPTGIRELDTLSAALARGAQAEREALEGLARRLASEEEATADLEERVRERTASLQERTRELEEARARVAGILEVAADAIVSTDAGLRITLFNRGAEATFGYEAEQVIGRPLEILVPKRHREAYRALLRDFARGPDISRHVEAAEAVVGLRRDGAEIPVDVSLSRLEVAGELVITAMMRDVTARREAEAAIGRLNRALQRRAAELEAINEELESFSYSVSHDLRAPLRGIEGFSRLVLEDHAEQLDPAGRRALDRVVAAAARMNRLIDDILALSRLARAPLRREPVDLSALARSVGADLRVAWPGREVELRVQEGLVARGDPGLLRVVLENLLGNAWKYTSRQPRAVVEVGAEQAEGGRTVYFVRDDGAGFDMAYAGRLFGAFQRLHTDAEFPGTGVGLSSVQRIVRRHGGEVWAEGAVANGATFRFTLGEDGEGE